MKHQKLITAYCAMFSIRVSCSPALKTICWGFWESEHKRSLTSGYASFLERVPFQSSWSLIILESELKNQSKEMLNIFAPTWIRLALWNLRWTPSKKYSYAEWDEREKIGEGRQERVEVQTFAFNLLQHHTSCSFWKTPL